LVYFDRPYHVAPLEGSEKAYVLLREALVVHLLHYHDEIRPFDDAPPAGNDRVHEVKFDGYRLECLKENGRWCCSPTDAPPFRRCSRGSPPIRPATPSISPSIS
jgi:hypothetical protein